MTNTDIEREFCQELWGYFNLAAADTRVDQDRLAAWVMVSLIKDCIIEEDRFKMFFKNGMNKLTEGRR